MIRLERCRYSPAGNSQFTLLVDSLSVNKGETVFIVGPSGSGKTTLLKALAGLLRNNDAELYINGDLIHGTGSKLYQKGLMFLCQELGLWPHLTCEEQVAFVATKGRSLKSDTSAYWLEFVGLKDKVASLPGILSGGEQKRLALARALAAKPQYLFLDEPFANIDVVLASELMEKIDLIQAEENFTLIKVSHHYHGIKNSKNEIVIMDHGQVVQRGIFAEIADRPANPWTKQWVNLML